MDKTGTEDEESKFMDRRRSENEALPSLIRSRIIVIEDLRSLVVVFDALESRLSFDERGSMMLSFWGSGTAFR